MAKEIDAIRIPLEIKGVEKLERLAVLLKDLEGASTKLQTVTKKTSAMTSDDLRRSETSYKGWSEKVESFLAKTRLGWLAIGAMAGIGLSKIMKFSGVMGSIFDVASGAIGTVADSILISLMPAIQPALNGLIGFAGWFAELPSWAQASIGILGALGLAFAFGGPIGLTMVSLGALFAVFQLDLPLAVEVAIGALAGLGVALAVLYAVGGPISLTVLAFGAFAGALAAIVAYYDGDFSEMLEDLKKGLQWFIDLGSDMLNDPVTAFNNLAAPIETVESAASDLRGVLEWFGGIDDAIFSDLGNAFTNVKSPIDGIVSPLNGLKSAITDITDLGDPFTSLRGAFNKLNDAMDMDVDWNFDLGITLPKMEGVSDTDIGALTFDALKKGVEAFAGPFFEGEGFKVKGSVGDAIIKPDGSIIKTSPEDTLVATKGKLTAGGVVGSAGGNNTYNLHLNFDKLDLATSRESIRMLVQEFSRELSGNVSPFSGSVV